MNQSASGLSEDKAIAEKNITKGIGNFNVNELIKNTIEIFKYKKVNITMGYFIIVF